MSNYQSVSDALDRGVEPEYICQTCPWDRLCINPPAMTRGEVEAKMPRKNGEPIADKDVTKSLLDVILFAGKDTQAQVCPVLAVRLRSAEGKEVADTIRSIMLRDSATAVAS